MPGARRLAVRDASARLRLFSICRVTRDSYTLCQISGSYTRCLACPDLYGVCNTSRCYEVVDIGGLLRPRICGSRVYTPLNDDASRVSTRASHFRRLWLSLSTRTLILVDFCSVLNLSNMCGAGTLASPGAKVYNCYPCSHPR
jgi:hypothetical protein